MRTTSRQCLSAAVPVTVLLWSGAGAATAHAPTVVEEGCLFGAATVVGTEGDDVLRGTVGADVIVGLGGDDTIDGLGGNDLICGDHGDHQEGAPGQDTIREGGGQRHHPGSRRTR